MGAGDQRFASAEGLGLGGAGPPRAAERGL